MMAPGDPTLSTPPPTPLAIFWDTNSVPIPVGVDPAELFNNIKAALRDHLPLHSLQELFAYRDPGDSYASLLLKSWGNDGTKIHDVPSPPAAYSLFQLMLCDLCRFCTSSVPRHGIVVLISREKHFELILDCMNHYGIRVAVLIPASDPATDYFFQLVDATIFDWLSVVRGSGKMVLKYFPPPAGDEEEEEVVEPASRLS